MFWGLFPNKGFRKHYRVLRDLRTKSDVQRIADDRKPLVLDQKVLNHDASKIYGLSSV